jgi:uncharacterized alkaline shock family protein YloU
VRAPQDRLPCGTELDALAAQTADGAPPSDPEHQARCPYCQTALGALSRSWDDLRAFASEPVPVPPALTSRIMSRIRELAARVATNLVLAAERGQTRISHAVIGQIARRAALAVPGVLFASVQTTSGQATDPTRVTLALRLVIDFGPAADALADTVRAAVHQHLPRLTGAGISSIDVRIEGIADPER